jgi:hypothetical protein
LTVLAGNIFKRPEIFGFQCNLAENRRLANQADLACNRWIFRISPALLVGRNHVDPKRKLKRLAAFAVFAGYFTGSHRNQSADELTSHAKKSADPTSARRSIRRLGLPA